MQLPQAILVGAIGFLGVLVGAAVNAISIWRISDKSRKADLYKVIYPMKIEAVRSLTDRAARLHREVWQLIWNDEPEVRERAVELYKDAAGLFQEAQGQEWLLGPDIKQAVIEFQTVVNRALLPRIMNERHVKGVFEIDANTWEPVSGYNAAFNNLQAIVRYELRMEEISRIFLKARFRKSAKQPPFIRMDVTTPDAGSKSISNRSRDSAPAQAAASVFLP